MSGRATTRAEARTAILQLRSLLLADAPVADEEARRLSELAAHLAPDHMHPIEVTEILPYLINIRSPEHDGCHHVDDSAGDAIRLLDELAARAPEQGGFSRLVRWWQRRLRG